MGRKATISLSSLPMEERTWVIFQRAETEYEKEWANLAKLDEKKFGPNVFAKLDKLRQQMFHAFDSWNNLKKHSVTVPKDEVTNLLVDTLMANMESLPDTEELTGLERHRLAKAKADDLYAAFKEWGVHVRETEIETPKFCKDCADELAA